ncbi:hypothetical protein RB653_001036 [Dictyostelium firmibasis]|uniref:FZ domain-containing protein n=1 Tax=Dictyostelium firmibasis TaxID=79012 RepID=A0AAN7TWA2_9MYCE
MRVFYSLFLFLFFYYPFIDAQQYYPIDPTGKCEPYIGDTSITPCSKYLTNPKSIYVSSTTNQTSAMESLDLYFRLLGSTGPTCQNAYTFSTLCSVFLPECEVFIDNSTNKEISIPKRTCLDTCNSVTQDCQITAYFNCKQLEPTSGLPLFPKEYTEYNLTTYGGGFNYTLQCYDPPKSNETIVTGSCPFPLIFRNRTKMGDGSGFDDSENLGYTFVNDDSYCTIPCPAPIFSEKQWDNIFTTSDVLSMISLISSIYLFITYMVINKKRNKYDYFFSFFVGSIILMSIAGTIGFSVGGTRKLICPEINRRGTYNDPAVAAAGWIFQFAIINAILWFSINSFELWFQIKFIKRKLDLLKFYIPVVLIISISLSVPLSAIGQFNAGLGNFVVWIESGTYQNWFFWGPLGFVLTIGTTFIGLVIWEIYKIVSSTNKSDFFKLQLKPLLNILLIYLTFIYMFGYNFYIHNSSKDFYGSSDEFKDCIINTDGLNCRIKGPPYSSILMFVFCLRIYGVYCFALYGFSPKTRSIWSNSFIFNNSMANKLKSLYSNSGTSTTKGGSSTIDIKLSTNMNTSMDSGGGKSSSMEPDDIIIY